MENLIFFRKKIRSYFLFMFFFNSFTIFLFFEGISQTKFSFIKNDSLKYHFGYVGMKVNPKTKGFTLSKFIIKIDLTDSAGDLLKRIKKNEWISKLTDSTTDWATNLLLYYLYERDATQYKVNITNREYWLILNQKQKEIRYWKKYLPKSPSK